MKGDFGCGSRLFFEIRRKIENFLGEFFLQIFLIFLSIKIFTGWSRAGGILRVHGMCVGGGILKIF